MSSTPVIAGSSVSSRTRNRIAVTKQQQQPMHGDSPALADSNILAKSDKEIVTIMHSKLINSIEHHPCIVKTFPIDLNDNQNDKQKTQMKNIQKFTSDCLLSALGLLFSKRSLLAVHHFFIDENKEKINQLNLNDPDETTKMSGAREFVIYELTRLMEKNGFAIVFNVEINVLNCGYGVSKPTYSDNGDLSKAEIKLALELFEWYEKTNDDDKRADYFAAITLAHEIIHVLGFCRFGKSEGSFSTPKTAKFEIKSYK